MTRTDKAALKLAIAAARAEDANRARQVDSMLKQRPWIEVAEFCSSCAQSRSLRLMPWEIAPCDLLLGDLNDPRAAAWRAAPPMNCWSACSVAVSAAGTPIRSRRLKRRLAALTIDFGDHLL